MTALAALCGAPLSGGDEAVTQMLALLALRGDCPTIVRPADGCCMGAALFEWQSEWAGSGVGRCGPVTVVADATLYYIADLVTALRHEGVAPASHSPADLIAAAVVAWGEGAASRLEGDFAFVALHTGQRHVIAARDWGGLRSLYFAATEHSIAFASEVTPLAQLPGVDTSINLPWLAEAAAARFESPTESVYRGIELVPAGFVVRVALDGANLSRRIARIRTFDPPRFLGDEHPVVPFEEAKRELRALMEQAVRERIPAKGDVSVGLSGGRDSTAVYALARAQQGERVKSMSVTYPEGDPGREDDVILDVLRMSGGAPHWIRSTELPILGAVRESAKSRHEPFAHVYAEFQEALARAARTLGTRVMLNGSGGDQLFSGEPTYLADLLREGKLRTLRSEWRMLQGGRDWKAFFKVAVWPNLGPVSKWLLALVRGGPYPDPFDRELPFWIRRDFAQRERLDARHRSNFPSRKAAAGAGDFERRWLLGHPFFPRVFAEAYRLYLKEGIELRTPLADGRLLRFAATRPRWERRTGWQVKVLMRASLIDVLPPSVTANRPRPTGTTEGLLALAIRRHLTDLLDELCNDSVLGSMGVVDVPALRILGSRIANGEGDSAALEVVYTILAEAWARSHTGNRFPVAG